MPSLATGTRFEVTFRFRLLRNQYESIQSEVLKADLKQGPCQRILQLLEFVQLYIGKYVARIPLKANLNSRTVVPSFLTSHQTESRRPEIQNLLANSWKCTLATD